MENIYTVKVTKNTCDFVYTGTLTKLIDVFGYTLSIGHSHNKQIKLNPKTIKSFITNLQNAYTVKEGCCYERSFVELVK